MFSADTLSEGGKYDIDIYQGADIVLEFVFKDGAGNPIDLSGYAVTAEVRGDDRGDNQLLLEFDVAVDTDAALVTLSAPADKTAAMSRGGRWDLKLSSGDVRRPLSGYVSLHRMVTV